MSGKKISQDLACLIFGIFAAIVSGVGIYTVNYIRNRMDSSSKINEVKKKLQTAQPNSKQEDGMLDGNPRNMRATASPFSLVQLHPTSSSTKSISKAMVSDNWKLPRTKEVEVSLNISKSNDNDKKLDVQMDIVVDPESKEPLNVHVDGKVDKDMNLANISGKAKSKAGGSVKIEGQLENDKTKKIINLDTKKAQTDKMVLRSKKN